MELRQPKPHKNPNWIPIIVFKNGEEIREFKNLQETFRYLRPMLNGSNKEIYEFIVAGVFEFKSYSLNGNVYDFRTYEERRKRHFEELAFNKKAGRKSR